MNKTMLINQVEDMLKRIDVITEYEKTQQFELEETMEYQLAVLETLHKLDLISNKTQRKYKTKIFEWYLR